MKKPPIKEYKLLHSSDHTKFADDCDKLIRQGWQPHKRIDVSRVTGSVYTHFTQVFVKR